MTKYTKRFLNLITKGNKDYYLIFLNHFLRNLWKKLDFTQMPGDFEITVNNLGNGSPIYIYV